MSQCGSKERITNKQDSISGNLLTNIFEGFYKLKRPRAKNSLRQMRLPVSSTSVDFMMLNALILPELRMKEKKSINFTLKNGLPSVLSGLLEQLYKNPQEKQLMKFLVILKQSSHMQVPFMSTTLTKKRENGLHGMKN